MAMSVEVNMSDGTCIYVRSTGGYAPDVMYDLQNRAATLMSHAAGISLQVVRALENGDTAPPAVDDEPRYEDETAE